MTTITFELPYETRDQITRDPRLNAEFGRLTEQLVALIPGQVRIHHTNPQHEVSALKAVAKFIHGNAENKTAVSVSTGNVA